MNNNFMEELKSIVEAEEAIDEMARAIIAEEASEYLEEFDACIEGEVDEGYYTFIGDKHYFEFEMVEDGLRLNGITEIDTEVI